ncbi:bifunctional diaminohydroxyphosphoribosylaminopyrimidine deaminase/5-amino-6-(5-phosphoribosylamino)uracil reductase RibD [Piscinibacter sakaiensis]|uniref:Riboflavin biosynthesis protein RibD n=1 Tax=Piscinibacter sakaiensis TaxID=1547922 RepID=A0A0K8P2N7_PISS1|nr:bifunctional diaminohydroxyphosphoribosylaminopyrimidine deaminase/5-amino-6-(5-phosphoribosylamino)uracil reductase RibD [Piscinibacter sakaiensis]GAP36891.1 diaminohydroxyphosphoribosylaminopyrimidine deaminase/5-amino-6-(5-phosphoribosylamino)uracil reductase [Piscinibacter sakaiensis]
MSPGFADLPIDALMREALALAERGFGLTEPNPRVGCVLWSADGRVIGRGHTQQAGGPHAEVMALRDAAAAGEPVAGATAVVTLEPCAHHGRTPPCCDALIAAGLARVVLALEDPFPQVAGQGAARLRAAGLGVLALPPGALADAAHAINIGFFSRVERGRPWVRMKVAASLDGRTALDNGRSQWITGEAARRDGHAWRRRASAVLTGIGTVRDDDPRLDVRLVETARQPLRVVVDSRLELPATARLLPPPGAVLVAAARPDAARVAALQAAGAEVLLLPGRPSPGPGGVPREAKVDLPALLAELARRGVNELHVEAGHLLNGSLLREGLVDELLAYVAPKLLGAGRGLAALGPYERLDEGPALRFVEATPVGEDLRVRARWRDAAWPPAR